MAKVYTKTGDKGTTGLYTGERVSKSSLRVNAYGTVDELQAVLGLARAHAEKDSVKENLYKIEKTLWLLMADVASIGKDANVTEDNVLELEKIIDGYDEKLEPLSHFLTPGDDKASSFIHVARTVTRRAERALWSVHDAGEPIHESDIRYLNRLSDLCFILARAESEL